MPTKGQRVPGFLKFVCVHACACVCMCVYTWMAIRYCVGEVTYIEAKKMFSKTSTLDVASITTLFDKTIIKVFTTHLSCKCS